MLVPNGWIGSYRLPVLVLEDSSSQWSYKGECAVQLLPHEDVPVLKTNTTYFPDDQTFFDGRIEFPDLDLSDLITESGYSNGILGSVKGMCGIFGRDVFWIPEPSPAVNYPVL